jgi:hypothetical protein
MYPLNRLEINIYIEYQNKINPGDLTSPIGEGRRGRVRSNANPIPQTLLP